MSCSNHRKELTTKKKRNLERLNEFKAALNQDQLRAYRKHFDMFDLNRDGFISARELRKVSKQMGYRLDDSQVNTIIQDNDLDENGLLSFDEFLLAMHLNLSATSDEEHRRAEVRQKFSEYDRDGSGTVTLEEAHAVLQKELSFSPRQSVELVRRYDLNGDGQLDYEEFVHFYAKIKHKMEKIRQMFDEFDSDGSGSVSVEEAKPILRKLGFNDSDIEAMVAEHDRNHDGELQYDEFVSFLWHA